MSLPKVNSVTLRHPHHPFPKAAIHAVTQSTKCRQWSNTSTVRPLALFDGSGQADSSQTQCRSCFTMVESLSCAHRLCFREPNSLPGQAEGLRCAHEFDPGRQRREGVLGARRGRDGAIGTVHDKRRQCVSCTVAFRSACPSSPALGTSSNSARSYGSS